MRNILVVILCTVLTFTSLKAYSNELDILLQNMADYSAKTQSLQANFIQEKQLSFLKQPLRSSGHLFFTKQHQGKPSILWEYLHPAPSGILFQKNEGWIWLKKRSSLKKAQGYEGNVLNSMIQQMLSWFVFEPNNIKLNYNIELIKDTTKQNPCLTLTPHDKSFFISMQICINNTNYTINSLQFQEKSGDNTKLTFENIKLNTAYPKTFPDGTAFP